MSYVTHNQQEIGISGTCLQGQITAKYDELVALFGKPTDGDGYKVDAEWNVRFDDGVVASIYNWKDGPNYCGAEGTPAHKITDWHIGGETKRAVDQVQITLDLHRECAGKKRSALEDLFESRADMLTTIKSKRGEQFASAVEIGSMVYKQMDIFAMLLGSIRAGVTIPPQVAHLVEESMSSISAKILAKYCESVGVASTESGANEVIAWVKRMESLEQAGIKPIMDEAMKRGGN
jgi:hypothetical protein